MIGSVKVMESRFVQSCTSIANAPQILSAEIAILGRSNVGKSSLINALLNNKNLAKSSSTPGKTRLVNLFESKWQCNSSKSNQNANSSIVSETQRVASETKQKSGLRSHERGNKTDSLLTKRVANLHDLSPQDEFAQKAEFAIHILDFPGFGYAKVSKSERDSWDKNLSTFLKKRESIKLFIHLIDSRHTNLPLDDEIRAFLRSNLRADADILEVFTKADKLKKSEIHALKGKILVSVTKKDLGQKDSKDSVESLRHAILRTMYHI